MSDVNRSVVRQPSRRDVIALGVGAFVVAAVPFVRRRRTKLVRRTIPIMGTVGEIGVVQRDEVYAHAAIDAAFDQLRLIERLMTRFNASSDVGRANASAAADAVTVSPETIEVLDVALRWAESSDGAFDPCLGRVADLWDVTNRDAPPARRTFSRLADRHLYRQLDMDRANGGGRIRLHDADAAIDLGGIAKGYGVDRAVTALREWGIDHGLVNVGGDLYALGHSEDGDPWHVGIRSPFDPTELQGHVDVSNAAVATSGDYLRFFRHGGRQYHHLLDPSTGEPHESAVRSITVRAGSCMTADAAATAAFGLNETRARDQLRRQAPDAEIISAS
ncbi:MAG: FAD:protein FMN transferase [Gemmatimonadota bacterium]|nr:FAD:protein FMN transferase [Gemmatimonadota bacterium]